MQNHNQRWHHRQIAQHDRLVTACGSSSAAYVLAFVWAVVRTAAPLACRHATCGAATCVQACQSMQALQRVGVPTVYSFDVVNAYTALAPACRTQGSFKAATRNWCCRLRTLQPWQGVMQSWRANGTVDVAADAARFKEPS